MDKFFLGLLSRLLLFGGQAFIGIKAVMKKNKKSLASVYPTFLLCIPIFLDL
jgi:hypothetical protein